MAEDNKISVEDIWKRPEPLEDSMPENDPGVGLWSRSRAVRVTSWALAIIVAIVLALAASTYLSGFSSMPEMFAWLLGSL
jgi:hypothetical protein